VNNYVLNWVKEGLIDWISRGHAWGVPVPEEKNMVFYVWFDAPIGYVSSTVAWAKKAGKKWKTTGRATTARFTTSSGRTSFTTLPVLARNADGVEDGFRLPDYIPTRATLTSRKKVLKIKRLVLSLADFLDAFP